MAKERMLVATLSVHAGVATSYAGKTDREHLEP